MACWSDSDNYFVNASFKVLFVDLCSDPLEMVPANSIKYDGPKPEDGPKGKEFQNLLLDKGFRLNRQGRAVVSIRKGNSNEEYDFFLGDRVVVQLSNYGFTKVVSPQPTQDVQVLKLLDEIKHEVKELRSLTEESRGDLAKKSGEVDGFRQNWNSEELRLTLEAITVSMKKVFVDVVDLKTPASGDPKSVQSFLQELGDVMVGRELDATWIGRANNIIASIASIFNQRNGISFGMVTAGSSSRTPASDLVQNLISLKHFVESRFFIDGSVIVKAYGLMNEKDIPVIFRHSEAGVDELKEKAKGTKPMDDIKGKSIFYGYFNIPAFGGTFKGILTKTQVPLPEDIMVKLNHRPKLDVERFWFVKANGEAIFENKSWGVDVLGFLRRMVDKTFVNQEGRYLLFDFTAYRMSELKPSSQIDGNSMRHYWNDWATIDSFGEVRYDANETPPAFLERKVSLPRGLVAYDSSPDPFTTYKKGTFGKDGVDNAFVYKGFCFLGKIKEVSGPDFRNNPAVSGFFDRANYRSECFVDSLATTYFVLNPIKFTWLKNPKGKVLPRIK